MLWAVSDRQMPLLYSCMLTSSTTQSPRLLAAQQPKISAFLIVCPGHCLGDLGLCWSCCSCPALALDEEKTSPPCHSLLYVYLFSCEMQVTRKTLSPAVCKALKEELSIR